MLRPFSIHFVVILSCMIFGNSRQLAAERSGGLKQVLENQEKARQQKELEERGFLTDKFGGRYRPDLRRGFSGSARQLHIEALHERRRQLAEQRRKKSLNREIKPKSFFLGRVVESPGNKGPCAIFEVIDPEKRLGIKGAPACKSAVQQCRVGNVCVVRGIVREDRFFAEDLVVIGDASHLTKTTKNGVKFIEVPQEKIGLILDKETAKKFGKGFRDPAGMIWMADLARNADGTIARMTQPEAEAYCASMGAFLPSAYPVELKGKEGFPNEDSDYTRLMNYMKVDGDEIEPQIFSNLNKGRSWSGTTFGDVPKSEYFYNYSTDKWEHPGTEVPDPYRAYSLFGLTVSSAARTGSHSFRCVIQ